MPTTIDVVSTDMNTVRPQGRIFGIMNDPDLIAITIFSVLGLLVAIGLAVFLPPPDDLATWLVQTS